MLDALRRGEPLNTFIMASPNAWNRRSIRTDCIVLPQERSPDDFDWSLFRGQEPTVIGDDADPERLSRLTWLLLSAGARLVCVIYEEKGVINAAYFRL